MTNEEYKQYQTTCRKEYLYLINEVLKNKISSNIYLSWFMEYQPILPNKNLKKKDVFKKINADYIEKLYVDRNYQFEIHLSTNHIKFPKYFIKFENGYKRYGCISFYGYRKSWIEDYFFYSKNVGEFFLIKIKFSSAYAFSKKRNLLTEITFKNNQVFFDDDVDDIYILSKSGNNHEYLDKLRNIKTPFFNFSYVAYDSLLPTNLDIYKNNQIIKSFDIINKKYRVNGNFIEIIDDKNNLIEQWNIIQDTNQ